MKIIGLTGGIGSGKSTVAGFLAELGAAVIDLDKTGHKTLRHGSQAWQQAIDAFGKRILAPDSEIDRAVLGDIVFKDPEALKLLNSIVHPAIDRIAAEKTAEFRRRGVKVLVVEAAAMIDAGKTGQVDELWITVAPESVVLDRLSKRSGYSDEKSRARITSQLPDKERIKQADVIIDTDCTLTELEARVLAEWQKLLKRL